MTLLFYFVHFSGKIVRRIGLFLDRIRFRIMMKNPKISIGKNIRSDGLPIILIGKNSELRIGDGLIMIDGKKNNFIGRDRRCLLNVLDNAKLVIGNNVGMTSSAIVASLDIRIGDNVRLGGNVIIYDTDFHSVKIEERLQFPKDPGVRKAPVHIEDNVFVGAHSIILKGVIIGKNSVIGAGSVVTKSIPPNEIWAGNPAKFIKKI